MAKDYYAEEIEGNTATIPTQRDYYAEEIENTKQSLPKKKENILDFAVKKVGSAFGIPENIPVPTSEQIATSGKGIGSLALGALNQGARDAITIPAHYFNQALLNLPRSATNTLGMEYPENSQNSLVNAANRAAGVMGAFGSPVAKGLASMGGASAPLRYKALAGLTSGLLYSPNEDMTDLGQRANQGILGAGVGTIAPLAAKGVEQVIKGTPKAIEAIKNIPDKFFRGGITKPEAIRIEQEYGSSNGSLIETIKTKLNESISKANESYKNAINSFKGNAINSQEFYRTVQKGLRDKGWIDLQGNPTARFQSGLDPVSDKLTNMYLDLKNVSTNAGKKITGQVISKADFSTYRDALGAMLKDRPSDILVMRARNSLYNSAEKSGMTGLKAARNAERIAFKKSDLFLDRKGDLKITENKLSRIGTKKPLSQQEMQHIQELQQYIKHNVIGDAAKINKINRAKEILRNMKQYGKGAAATLVIGETGRKLATGKW